MQYWNPTAALLVFTVAPSGMASRHFRLAWAQQPQWVTGVGAAVVFQNLFRLGNNDEFPADQFLTNELECAAALVTGELGFRQIKDDFLYRQILCQLVNGSLFLPGVGLDGKGFFRRFFCLVVLGDFCLIEQTYLVLAQDIVFFSLD